MAELTGLTWEIFEENYLKPDVPASLLVHGTPEVRIIFQPTTGQLGMLVDVDMPEAPVVERRNIFSALMKVDAGNRPWIYVTDRSLYREFYALCGEVADRVQQGNEKLSIALSHTIEAFELLLRSAAALSPAIETGLIGEVLVLDALIELRGNEALSFWRGPERDKHDFRFDSLEIEVKTTVGESRRHWINGLGQLEASPDCELELLSVHLIRTAGDGGFSLRELIRGIRGRLSDSPGAIARFNDGINAVANDERLDSADNRFTMRNLPAAYPIRAGFPRLREQSIKSDLGPAAVHILDVRYEIDLSNLASDGTSATTQQVIGVFGHRSND